MHSFHNFITSSTHIPGTTSPARMILRLGLPTVAVARPMTASTLDSKIFSAIGDLANILKN